MNLLKIFIRLISCILMISIFGCTSSEIGESKDVAPASIYQQYHISYNEGDEAATVYARFRFAGEKGTTLVLSKPSSIKLDGVSIPVDSSEYEGAFYKKSVPVANFYGDHHFIFTDIANREYDNIFSFEIFKLVNIPETAARNQALCIQIAPLHLEPEDYIVINSFEPDSTFRIHYSGKDTGQFISIPAEALQPQNGIQIKLAATLYKKVLLQQNTTEGSNFEIVYALKPFTIRLRH